MFKPINVGIMFVLAACSSTVSNNDGGTGQAGAGAGTTGQGGQGGTTGPAVNQSVLERNKNPSRDGHFIQPALTKAAAARMAPDTTFTASFTGNMWASPLYIENGPGGAGAFFAVATNNNVYALHETTGAMLWMHNIGTPAMANGVSCGNIHPMGILSTPVIDGASRTIYVAGAIGNATTIQRHEVHALSVEDGASKTGWPIDVATIQTGGTTTFMAPPANQRSALSLVNGTLYVAYGGHVGDCGTYHGWVFGINTANPATMRGGWATGGVGEGIWPAGGMASDGNGVFATTGNRTQGSGAHADSEELVRITGVGTRSDLFYPTTWSSMDDGDADFSSVNPVFVQLPGATPSNIVVGISKDGHMYLLDAANLGGMGGQKVDFMLANGAMAIHTAPGAYRTAQGLYVMLSTTTGAMNCPGGGSGRQVMAVRLAPGNPPAPTIAWCAPMSSPTTGPIATTTDGTSDAIVWYMSGGQLRGVDGDTGATIYSGTTACSGIRQWTSPIAVKGRIVAGGDGHLCSWSPQ